MATLKQNGNFVMVVKKKFQTILVLFFSMKMINLENALRKIFNVILNQIKIGFNLVMVNMHYILVVIKLFSLLEFIAHQIMNFLIKLIFSNIMESFFSQDQIVINLQQKK